MQSNNEIALVEIFKHFHSAKLAKAEKQRVEAKLKAEMNKKSAPNLEKIKQIVYSEILESVANRISNFNGSNFSEFKGLVVDYDRNSIHEYLQAALEFADCDKLLSKACQEIYNMTSKKLEQTYPNMNTTDAIKSFIIEKYTYPTMNLKYPEAVQAVEGDQGIKDCLKEITKYIEEKYRANIVNIVKEQIIQQSNNSNLIKIKKDKKLFPELMILLEQNPEIKVIKTLHSLKYHEKLELDTNTLTTLTLEDKIKLNQGAKKLVYHFQKSLDEKIDLSTILNQLISAEKQRSLTAQMETLTINSEKQQSKQEEEKKQESSIERIQTQNPQEQSFVEKEQNKKKKAKRTYAKH